MTMLRIHKRLVNSAVFWSWIFNFLRLASGIILLPLVLHKLSTADLGMYYVLLSLAALSALVDFGFGETIGRFTTYAMGGAREIQAQGLPQPGDGESPNYTLLWELLATTRRIYRFLTLAVLVIVGIWGTYMVELRIHETSSVLITRLAWGATLAGTVFDIYANWWCVYLRSMNEVVAAARISVLVMVVRLAMAAGLLCAGAGLLSLPIATVLSDGLQRWLARSRCLALLKNHPPPGKIEVKKIFKLIWPNTWRVGVLLFSGYLTLNANTAICLSALGLAANAKYGLSLQLMNIAASMAAVWIAVKRPLLGQILARHDLASVRQIFWPRFWLQNLTFLVLAAGVVLCGSMLLNWVGGGKEILPMGWLAVLMLYTFLSLQYTTWSTLMATGNNLAPLVWPTVATSVLSLILSLLLVHFTTLGLGALVLGPLLAGGLFNFWYWPAYAARGIGTTLFHFIFLGPKSKPVP
jgi:O-antigen/teichoic acid export membrane protein